MIFLHPPFPSLFPYTTLFRSNVPPHNMREVIDGILAVIEHRGQPKDARTRALLKTVAGPDFPTGGFIVGRQGIFQADRKSTRLNSSHLVISYAVFCLKTKINI